MELNGDETPLRPLPDTIDIGAGEWENYVMLVEDITDTRIASDMLNEYIVAQKILDIKFGGPNNFYGRGYARTNLRTSVLSAMVLRMYNPRGETAEERELFINNIIEKKETPFQRDLRDVRGQALELRASISAYAADGGWKFYPFDAQERIYSVRLVRRQSTVPLLWMIISITKYGNVRLHAWFKPVLLYFAEKLEPEFKAPKNMAAVALSALLSATGAKFLFWSPPDGKPNDPETVLTRNILRKMQNPRNRDPPIDPSQLVDTNNAWLKEEAAMEKWITEVTPEMRQYHLAAPLSYDAVSCYFCGTEAADFYVEPLGKERPVCGSLCLAEHWK